MNYVTFSLPRQLKVSSVDAGQGLLLLLQVLPPYRYISGHSYEALQDVIAPNNCYLCISVQCFVTQNLQTPNLFDFVLNEFNPTFEVI